ncbi:translesion error-prone DNA polymerase V autoproteolytic subunit [candidate division WWE3 bacterium]|nr:translesion error-prone DNA polymerase V autoproteolytic subunit [candidate division WWE3 bacterium]
MMTQPILPTKQRLQPHTPRRKTSRAAVGFASPASDFIERNLDLNVLLIKHPAATFFVRVEGNAMEDAGINEGDILIVDRSTKPSTDQVVIAALNGELVVRTMKTTSNGILLVANKSRRPTIHLSDQDQFEVWGTVTSVVHRV